MPLDNNNNNHVNDASASEYLRVKSDYDLHGIEGAREGRLI